MSLVTWQEFTSGGRPQGGSIVEDLRDFIENVSPVDRPALARFRRSRVPTTFVEWQEDVLEDRGHNATVEGAAFTNPGLTAPARLFAHVQSFSDWGRVADEQRLTQHAGLDDMLTYQENKAVQQVMNDIEHAIHRGSSITGATSAARQTAGLLNIFGTETFTSSSGTTLTEEVYGDYIQSFTDNNFDVFPTLTFVNSWLKRTISLYSTNVTRNVNAAEKIQILTIERHNTDFGDTFVHYSRDQLRAANKTSQGNSIVILDPNFFETGWLRSLMSERLARDGLRDRFQINAMMTLIYRTAKAGGGATGVVANI
jgi:hypothetical protein